MNKIVTVLILLLVIGAVGWYAMKNSGSETNNNTATQSRGTSTQAAEKPEVVLTSSGFEPSTLTVKVGTKVTWTNKSGDLATVNSNNHPTHLLYPPLNLGEFKNGDSLSLTFDKAGTFGYHNHLNPSETAEIVVQ